MIHGMVCTVWNIAIIQHFKFIANSGDVESAGNIAMHFVIGHLQVNIFGVIKVYSIDGGYDD